MTRAFKHALKQAAHRFQQARSYHAQRSYFTSKTAEYSSYLDKQGLLRDLPKEHRQRVLELWTPLLSLSLVSARTRVHYKSE